MEDLLYKILKELKKMNEKLDELSSISSSTGWTESKMNDVVTLLEEIKNNQE